MKKILTISYFFNFLDTKSTAISINSRIAGIEKSYNIDIICMECDKSNNMLEHSNFKTIELENKNIESVENKERFKNEVMNYYMQNLSKYDVIILHSNFKETHNLVSLIKEVNKKQKIILYMPDPFIGGVLKYTQTASAYLEGVEAEKSAYDAADKVIVTNQNFKEHMCNFYPEYKEKISPILHSYIPIKDEKNKNSLDIVFLGRAYFGRRLDYIYIAFDELLKENIKYRKFRLVTTKQPRVSTNYALSKIEHLENFVFLDYVPFEQAVRIEKSAFLLLNIVLPIDSKTKDPYFPTKLAQYFKYKKPILTLSDVDGFSVETMKETNNYYCKNNVKDIKIKLKEILNKEEIKFNSNVYEKYSMQEVTKEFIDLIENL